MKNRKLEEMKEDYVNRTIPLDLRNRVLQSIAQAKEDNQAEKANILEEENILEEVNTLEEENEVGARKDQTMKSKKTSQSNHKFLLYSKRIVQVAAGLLIAITIAANSNAGIAHAMEQIPVLGAITKVVTFRNYEVKNENTEANIKVPKVEDVTENPGLSNATQQINKSVEEYTNQIIAQFEADVAEFATYEGEDGGPHEAVDTGYEVITDTDTLFSLRINTTIAQGGSINMAKIYHIDKRTDSVITLQDIFAEGTDYKTVLSENVKEQMRAKMKADEGVLYFIDSEEGMDEFDFNEIKEDQNFYINEEGKLMLVFDEYEVAPGYMGVVEFEIPSDVVQSIVKEGFVK